MQVLAAFPGPPPGAREQVAAMAGIIPPGSIRAEGHHEVLALVDGRRSIRDLAFARGRGLYVTLPEVARMRSGGLIASAAEPAPAGDESGRRRRGAVAASPAAAGLPRRHKDRLVPPKRTEDLDGRPLTAVLRLLRPRADGDGKARDIYE